MTTLQAHSTRSSVRRDVVHHKDIATLFDGLVRSPAGSPIRPSGGRWWCSTMRPHRFHVTSYPESRIGDQTCRPFMIGGTKCALR
jgi:hypothetical protein